MEAQTSTKGKSVQTPKPYYPELSHPVLQFRPWECSTESAHLEALFLFAHNARDLLLHHFKDAFQIAYFDTVLRFINLKVDQYDPKIFPPLINKLSGRTQPPWKHLAKQHFRVVTTVIAVGKTSMRMQHRFLTVPKSQLDRDFNNRDQDAMYQQLKEGDEPERQFACVEDGLVCIKWQTDEKGHRFFKSHPCPIRDLVQVKPPVVQLIRPKGPDRRPAGSPRPANAFKYVVHVRKSDEDQLGHVTNSRYAAILDDIVKYGLSKGYYANGTGPHKTSSPLPRIAEHLDNNTLSSEVAVPAGSQFYKEANVREMYVGYEHELKVKITGVYAWSWVEKDKVQENLDVVIVEICLQNTDGSEKLISLCRVILGERQRVVQRASL
ncbi:hypothetical protein BGZ49_003311 [Haplosporangium sp. Z 27]|nr:hypothetical protein BGZ49_003311 [Haplosporangium sp. Z 27]